MTALGGIAASPGRAVGRALVLGLPPGIAEQRASRPWEEEAACARAALQAAAGELDAAAERLRAQGRLEDADMVAAGALLGLDPALERAVVDELRDGGRSAAAAIARATDAHAARLAALPDELLAARAADVTSFGRRAARLASGSGAPAPQPSGERVLVAEDVGPADVAEHETGLVAIALAGGGATAHAAIVARSLGLPMVVGLGPDVLEIATGTEVIVDGDGGRVLGSPSPAETSRTRAEMARRAEAQTADRERRELPAVTSDGRRLRVLGNAAGAAEVEVALAAGAEGVGLLRTELAFLDAGAWPSEAEHSRALAPVLAAAGGAPVTVRLLDFGGDKLPPFLRGRGERGIALQLSAPGALRAQLAAIADALAAGAPLRVLIPLVEDPAQVRAVRAELPAGAEVGAMVETPGAAARADELAACCAFLSIGTNDLSHAVLGSDRFAAGSAPAHHPRVLAAVARVARATAATEIPLEVCGEAASDPVTMPLLVGLGVDELSVGAARVGTVREWVRRLSAADAAGLAEAALRCRDAAAVAALVRGASGVRLDEPGDAGLESVEGGVRTVALGP